MYKRAKKGDQNFSEWPTRFHKRIEIDEITFVSTSPHNAYLVAGDIDGRLHLLSSQTFSVLKTFEPHLLPIIALQWSPNADKIISVSNDWTIYMLSTLTGESLFIAKLAYAPILSCFCATKFGLLMIYGQPGLEVLDLATNEVSEVIVDLEDQEVTAMCFISEEVCCIGTSKGMLHFYNFKQSRELKSMRICTSVVPAMAFCSYAKVLSVSCSDKSFRIFFMAEANFDDLSDLAVDLRMMNMPDRVVYSNMFVTESGEYVYATTEKGTISIWNLFAQVMIASFRMPDSFQSWAFDTMRNFLFVCCTNGVVYCFKPPATSDGWSALIPGFTAIYDLEVFDEPEDAWDLREPIEEVNTKKIEMFTRSSRDTDGDVSIPFSI